VRSTDINHRQRQFRSKDISPRRHFVPKTKSPGYFVKGHFGRIPFLGVGVGIGVKKVDSAGH
jgi:hypothetical protein